jgi:hypothetical protein
MRLSRVDQGTCTATVRLSLMNKRLRLLSIATAALFATTAQAQLADSLSRRIQPNAIDRSLADSPTTSLGAQADADRQRSEQAARDAAARRGPPPTSTMVDGPAGVQRAGSGIAPPSPAAAPLPPLIPQS